jgi:hypothetical protein
MSQGGSELKCVSAIAQCTFFGRFDANDDGKVDFDEFQKILEDACTTVEANEKFASDRLRRARMPKCLTDKQLELILLAKYSPQHAGPGVYERQSHKQEGMSKKARACVYASNSTSMLLLVRVWYCFYATTHQLQQIIHCEGQASDRIIAALVQRIT